MKLSEQLRGVGQVWRFTLVQHFKNRSNLITLIVMLVLSLISVPVASALMGGMDASGEPLPDVGLSEEPSGDAAWSVTELYLCDESGLDLAASLSPTEGMQIHPLSEPPAQTELAALSDTALVAHVFFDAADGTFRIATYTGEQSVLRNHEIHNVALYITDALEAARWQNLTAEEQAWLTAVGNYTVERGDASELLDHETEDVGFETGFAVEYTYAIILLMLCMMSSSYIIRAVVEEKSSKLIDLLMVSVQPLALLCGKILAMMTVVFGTLLSIAAAFGLSSAVTGLFMDTSVIGGRLESAGVSLSLLDLGWETAVVVLISLLLSYLTYSIMSGIAGASCSAMTEIDGAMMGVTFTALGGYIVSCVVTAIPGRAVAIASSLIPFVSGFCAPVQYVLGRIDLWVLLLSWLIQAVLVVLLARLGAKVYRDLILRQGKRLRLGEVLKMAKNLKGGARREA